MHYQRFQYSELSEVQRKALDEAERISQNAYNPYSKFYVGACLVAVGGQLITGTNFENAAFGETICAERAAVVRANAMGLRGVTHIAIIGHGEDFDTTEVTAPCGSCR